MILAGDLVQKKVSERIEKTELDSYTVVPTSYLYPASLPPPSPKLESFSKEIETNNLVWNRVTGIDVTSKYSLSHSDIYGSPYVINVQDHILSIKVKASQLQVRHRYKEIPVILAVALFLNINI